MELIKICLNVPYILRIFLALISIVIVHRITKSLVIGLLTSILIIVLWCAFPFTYALKIIWTRISGINDLFLLVVVTLVIWLSEQMQGIGLMEELVKKIKFKFSRHQAIALLPALIGLLPMPGGALFSAPLIADIDKDKMIDDLTKTKINYWFRHVWECWWPLYPGVLLAIDLSGFEVWQFCLLMLPFSIIGVIVGYFFMLKEVKDLDFSAESKQSDSEEKFIFLFMPILLVIIGYIIVRVFFPFVYNFSKYLPLLVGILMAILYLQFKHPLNLYKWKKIIIKLKTFNILIIVILIRIYSAFIEAQLSDGIFLMEKIQLELNNWNIPLMLIIIIIPFISGLTTGLGIGFVGASFPIIINLITKNSSFNVLFATVELAYISGYVGMMLSPVHICNLVTNEYFNTNLLKSTIETAKPALIVLLCAIILYLIL